MATYDLNTLPPHIRATLCQLVEAFHLDLRPVVPRCPHATDTQACCSACTVTSAAEAIVAEVQPPEAPGERWGTFPRHPLEQGVLEVLQVLSPLPATTLQVASLVDRGSYRQVRTILQALAMLHTIEHPRKGYYRHLQEHRRSHRRHLRRRRHHLPVHSPVPILCAKRRLRRFF